MWWSVLFASLATGVVLALSLYFRRMGNFWKKLKVPHTAPRFPLGDFQRGGFTNNLGVLFRKFYEEFAGEKFFGIWMFTNPVLIVRDPELVKAIFVKDFMHFHDRGVYYNEKDDPLSAHMFAVEGLKWKNIRAKLSPTFTSGKMKMMFPLMMGCCDELEAHLRGAAERGEAVDMREVAARFMTDVISLCAFGINTNSLKNPDAEFRKMGQKFAEPTLKNFLLFYIQFSAPKLGEFFKLRVLPKKPAEFFLGAIREVMDEREKKKVRRNDFMQLLMEIKNEGATCKDTDREQINEKPAEVGQKLTFEEAAAQAFVFFLGGFETTSSTVQFAMYEIAKNPKIQDKLRREISKGLAKHDGKLTYESVRDIPYLNKVIEETLRKYPVVPSLQRECNRDYRIQDTDVVIPKGTLIHIPVYGIQMDEKHYPDPEKFDPERFSEEEKQKRHAYAYLPFGEGPRNCVGKRFGQIQVQLALVVLLQNFRFELSENSNEPITFDPRTFVLVSAGKIHLKIKPL